MIFYDAKHNKVYVKQNNGFVLYNINDNTFKVAKFDESYIQATCVEITLERFTELTRIMPITIEKPVNVQGFNNIKTALGHIKENSEFKTWPEFYKNLKNKNLVSSQYSHKYLASSNFKSFTVFSKIANLFGYKIKFILEK